MTLNALIRDIEVPPRMARRPVSAKGFPVPWFCSMIGGQWDFVNVDPRKAFEAFRKKLCWLCGERLGQYQAFVIGPMCAINRTTAEPPTHRECAEYAVRACPFLLNPATRRNEKERIGDGSTVPGIMVQHNPGACVIWITRRYSVANGLVSLGDPVSVSWFAKGRPASRGDVEASIAKGMPFLEKAARAENAMDDLQKQIARMRPLLPVE